MLWIEQEFVHGEDLSRLLRRSPGGFPLPMALFVAVGFACRQVSSIATAWAPSGHEGSAATNASTQPAPGARPSRGAMA